MKETTSTFANIPRIEPPLGNFSQVCTVLLIQLAFYYKQPVLVLITTIIMALNALLPTASPYRLLYHYVLVPQGWLLKPRTTEEGKLAPYRLSRISIILLLASTVLLFPAPALALGGSGLGWMIAIIAALLLMADLGVRLSIWILWGYFSRPPDGENPMIPKKTIALLYALGLGLIITDFLLNPHPPYSMIAHPPMFIGALLYMGAWLVALTNAMKVRSCLWFLSQILFPFTPFTLPIYVFLGPGPTRTASNGSPVA